MSAYCPSQVHTFQDWLEVVTWTTTLSSLRQTIQTDTALFHLYNQITMNGLCSVNGNDIPPNRNNLYHPFFFLLCIPPRNRPQSASIGSRGYAHLVVSASILKTEDVPYFFCFRPIFLQRQSPHFSW